nr:MAG TPA: tail protein [Caudoviricetes sp.]
MSNADYIARGTGTFCTFATLAASIGPLDTSATLTGLQSVGPGDRYAGMAVMIGNEIAKLTSWTDSSMVVTRGCADTIPSSHNAGTLVWFLQSGVGTDSREYLAAETIGVKVQAKTTSRVVPIEYVPPIAITFNSRFIRPYPPANLRGNTVPWFNVQTLTAAAPNLALTWAHRNRVTQMDVLLSHGEASVSPEVGTTYRLRFFTTGNSQVGQVTGIADSNYTITRDALAIIYNLFPLTDTGNYAAYALLDSQRDGYDSLQAYRIDFLVDTTGLALLTPRLMEDGTPRLTEDGIPRILEN